MAQVTINIRIRNEIASVVLRHKIVKCTFTSLVDYADGQ